MKNYTYMNIYVKNKKKNCTLRPQRTPGNPRNNQAQKASNRFQLQEKRYSKVAASKHYQMLKPHKKGSPCKAENVER